jgi:hypothetical protein
MHGNSVRVRVTRSEVASLGRGVAVEQVTRFGPDAELVSAVRPSPAPAGGGGGDVRVTFAGDALVVWVPADTLAQWAGSERVGIEGLLDVGADCPLRVLIEKDFACLHGDDDGGATVDAFPNPRAT